MSTENQQPYLSDGSKPNAGRMISHAMKVLYEWANEGAIIYITDYDGEKMTNEFESVVKVYQDMKQPGGMRTKTRFKELVKPWKIKDPGLLTLEDWFGFEHEVTGEMTRAWGGGGFFGGFLEK